MLDETEIKIDKYFKKICKNEQEVIEQKTQEKRETEEQRQRETRLKHAKELLIKRPRRNEILHVGIYN